MRFPIRRALFAAALASLAGQAHADFTPGNLVVSQVGDGTTVLSTAAAQWSLIEYPAAGGAPVSTLNLTSLAPGGAFTGSSSSTSEGCLTLSGDGRYLMLGGYGAVAGTANIANTNGTTAARIVSRISSNFTADFSTALSDAYGGAAGSPGNIRSVTSDDGSRFWTGGNGNTASLSGVRAAPLGATTSTQLAGAPLTNIRVVNIFNGQLYCSSASGTFQGVSMVGSGLPTSGGQTISLLPGFPTAAGPSSYDFYFANTTTLYVADDRSMASGGGIQKWVFGGASWSLAYTLGTGGTVGARGLTGAVVGGVATLYAITAEGTANRLISITDTGASSTAVTLAIAGANTLFRGVDFAPVPTPGSLSLLTLGAIAAFRRRR